MRLDWLTPPNRNNDQFLAHALDITRPPRFDPVTHREHASRDLRDYVATTSRLMSEVSIPLELFNTRDYCFTVPARPQPELTVESLRDVLRQVRNRETRIIRTHEEALAALADGFQITEPSLYERPVRGSWSHSMVLLPSLL